MATGGSSEPLNLVDILNLPAVVETNNWKEVGLELRVEKHVLDRIEEEHWGRINDCKREMLDCWLKTDGRKSLEEVNAAVKRAKKRLEGAPIREESRECIRKQGNQTITAINQAKESLERMDDMNRDIVYNQIKLEEELKKQKRNSESFQTQCTEEDMEWSEGEQRRERDQIKEALQLEAHNLQRSQFVKRFLHDKGLKNLSNEEVECYLRRDLLEKEVTRSRQIRLRCQRAKELHKELEYLLHETREWKRLVEERATRIYPRIVESLKELGVKEETFQALEQQLEKLRNTLRECTTAVEDCDQALRKGKDYLRNCEGQLKEFSESFGEVVGRTGMVLRGLENNVEQIMKRIALGGGSVLAGSIVGSLVGAGAAAGTVVPVVGTIVGAAAGALVGGIAVASSVNINKPTDHEKVRFKMKTKQRTLRKCKDTEKQAKYELKELQKMLRSKI